MENDLRPRSLGEILDRTAEIYRTNFPLLAGISAVYAGILLALNLANIGAQQLLRSQHLSAQMGWLSVGFALLMVPLIVVMAGAEVAANNRAVAWVHLGQPATIRGAYLSIFPKIGRYLWLMVIIAFVVYIPFLILFGGYFTCLFVYLKPLGALSQAGAAPNPQAALALVGVTAVFVLLGIPALVYSILMGLRYSLALPASVVEDLKARQALKRSIELSKGARGRIFLLALLIVAIQLGLTLIAQVPFFVAVVKFRGVLPAWIQALQQIVNFFINTFVGPIYATGITLFYYDQRVRKEGFDILWMMQAAGLAAPEVPSPAQIGTEDGAAEAQPPALPEPAGPETHG